MFTNNSCYKKNSEYQYSISCGLSAAPTIVQRADPGTSADHALTAKRPAQTGLVKVIINTLSRCRCRGKTARNTVTKNTDSDTSTIKN
jgi:hypothetical protein